MRFIAAVLLSLCITFTVAAVSAESRSQVVQLKPYGAAPSASLYLPTSDAFKDQTNANCLQGSRGLAGPVTGALIGVFIDWMFDKAMGNLSDRFKRRLAKYSSTYSNPPIFADMFHDDFWTQPGDGGQSCVVFQRVECEDDECVKDKVGFSVGFLMQREKNHLKLVPFALEISRAAAEHRGGNYSVATQLTLQAPTINRRSGGAMWVSPQVPIAAHTCKIAKGAKSGLGCFKKFTVDAKAWQAASVLPRPPATVQAFVVSVAEVGDPPRGLKGLSEFLDTSQGDLSDVLSAALKEKLKLNQNE